MSRRLFFMIGVLIACLLWAQVCFAANEIWANKNYDFKKIKTVVVKFSLAQDENVQITEITRRNMTEAIAATFWSDSKAQPQYISWEQLEKSVGEAAGQDIGELRHTDPEQYKSLIQMYLPVKVDAVLDVHVDQARFAVRRAPQEVVTRTEYEYKKVKVPIYNGYGIKVGEQKKTIPLEKQRLETVPEHNVGVGVLAMNMRLTATQKEEDLLLLTYDLRKDETEPVALAKKVWDAAKGTLKKLTKK